MVIIDSVIYASRYRCEPPLRATPRLFAACFCGTATGRAHYIPRREGRQQNFVQGITIFAVVSFQNNMICA
jgi:hypothetical protein